MKSPVLFASIITLFSSTCFASGPRAPFTVDLQPGETATVYEAVKDPRQSSTDLQGTCKIAVIKDRDGHVISLVGQIFEPLQPEPLDEMNYFFRMGRLEFNGSSKNPKSVKLHDRYHSIEIKKLDKPGEAEMSISRTYASGLFGTRKKQTCRGLKPVDAASAQPSSVTPPAGDPAAAPVRASGSAS